MLVCVPVCVCVQSCQKHRSQQSSALNGAGKGRVGMGCGVVVPTGGEWSAPEKRKEEEKE